MSVIKESIFNSKLSGICLDFSKGSAAGNFDSKLRKIYRTMCLLAETFNEGEFIGLEATVSDGKVRVFTSHDLRIETADLEWMVGNYADICNAPDGEEAVPFAQDRFVYTLKHIDDMCDDDTWGPADGDINDMVDVLVQLKAVIRAAVGSSRCGPRFCKFFISIPQKMPIRLEASFIKVFEQYTAVGADDTDCMEERHFIHLADTLLTPVLLRFAGLPADEISIEDLDFRPRTYNSLKRAGIITLQQIANMSEKELAGVRNLGMAGIEEIKSRLKKYGVYLKKETPAKRKVHREELDDLIGLDDVKAQVKRIAAFARMQKEMSPESKDQLSIALNMEFVGNPGTAKTTVARIVAGMFHEMGLLSTDECVEVGRADLVGRYTGETAIKVKEVFEKAAGKVLFIDEAYSLCEYEHGGYGDEAINTIVQEVENKRDDMVVIFAGYPDEMKEFIDRNPGLRSRIPFRIEFKDYSAEQLVQIAEYEAARRGFSLDDGSRAKVTDICSGISGNPSAGNGRFCRNLVENAILNYAERVYGDKGTEGGDCVLSSSDISVPSGIKPKEQRTFGFRSA